MSEEKKYEGITGHKTLLSEFNVLKLVHMKIVNEYVDYRLENLKEFNNMRDKINELNGRIVESDTKVRRDILREVLDAIYIEDPPFGDLCITQKQYEKWEAETLD